MREVKESVQNSPDLVNQQLETAANKGYVAAVEYLIAHGADVNLRSPIVAAAAQGNEAMVQLLLSHGAAVDSLESGTGRTALSYAVQKGFMTVCRTLVAHGADVNAKDKSGSTPLQTAIGNGHLSAAEFLITNKAQINVSSFDGMTPLLSSIMGGNMELVELLLNNHADANQEIGPPKKLHSPLWWAIEYKRQPVVQLLLDHGAKPNEADSNGDTPLVKATKQEQTEMIGSLIEHGADVNAADNSGSTPLHWAVQAKSLADAEMLIKNKAQIDAKTSDGFTPLAVAIIHDTGEQMVKLLLANHADANLETGPTNDRHDPLIWAVRFQRTPMVQLLLEFGAKPNAVDADGDTALVKAINQGNVDMIRILIEHGADVNFLDKQGRPPLAQLRAASEANPGIPGSIRPLRLPGSPSPRDEAAPKIEEMLIKAGADPDYNRRRAIWTCGDDGSPKNEIFQCPTNSMNHYTLLEFLATLYQVNLTQRQQSISSYAYEDALVPFPEFARVSIHRLDGKRAEILHVNVEEILRSGDPSKDVALQAGDLIEIAKQEHKVAETWFGLSPADVTALNKCLVRTVQVVSKGHTNTLALVPSFGDSIKSGQFGAGPLQAFPDNKTNWLAGALNGRTAETVVRSFLLYWVVRDANVLLNTWDLSRVQLSRGGAKTTFDLTANPAPNVWLEDGDVIEIPELGEGAPVTEAK